MKTIYNYSKQTFELTHESMARADPKRLGNYLIPAFATDIKPPKTKKNQVVIFDKEAKEWKVKKDYRGKEFWNKETKEKVVIDYIGDIKNKDKLTTQEAPNYTKWNKDINNWEFNRDLWLEEEVRPKRDERIKKTDIYMFADLYNKLTKEQQEELTEIRQQLRDLPNNIQYENPIYPKLPSYIK